MPVDMWPSLQSQDISSLTPPRTGRDMGDFIRQPQVDFEDFDAFRDTRPKEEKWELIGGVPMMMPPPTPLHRRISGNIHRAINSVLDPARSGWRADCEIGLKLPEDRKYNPEPDVTVIDRDSGLDQIYAERFYFVAEVLSEANRPEHRDGSDQPQVLAVKLAWYKKHPHCRGVLFLEQRRVEGELHLRGKRWQKQQLTAPADRIVIPDIGDIGSLGALYRDTPLYPGEAAL